MENIVSLRASMRTLRAPGCLQQRLYVFSLAAVIVTSQLLLCSLRPQAEASSKLALHILKWLISDCSPHVAEIALQNVRFVEM
jgi:hypothetical protein